MKKALIMVLVLIGLAVFLPFASSSPDGLEKVTSTLGAQEQASVWQGLMPDYSIALVGNSYVSTLLAGIFGTTAVLAATLLVGKVITSKRH
jgi:hypothetical protein